MGCQRSMACSHQYPAAPKGFASDAPTGSHIIEAMGAFSEHHTLHTCFSKAFFPLETLWHATTANTPWPAITAAKQAKLFAGHHAAPAPISYPASFWDCFWYLSSCTWGVSSGSRWIIKIAHLHLLRELPQGTPPFQHSSLHWVFQWHPLFPGLPHSEPSLCAPVWFTVYTDPSAGAIVCPSISVSPTPHLRHRG